MLGTAVYVDIFIAPGLKEALVSTLHWDLVEFTVQHEHVNFPVIKTKKLQRN